MKFGENPEMVMDAFRMARSGNYRKASEIVTDLKRAYPEATDRQIKDAILKLAQIIERQHA